MKYVVGKGCIGCAMCVAACPTVFRMNGRGLAEAVNEDVSKDTAKLAAAAKNNCPSRCIREVR
ncbi:MAG TPA: ferredoxin [Lachnospiraceae bacterium]|nr:ferredoxin [Lachnospiraceae bacterium]